jgi:hypothetical protein
MTNKNGGDPADLQDPASEIVSAGAGRREFLRSDGVAAAAVGAVAASIGPASADVPSQGYRAAADANIPKHLSTLSPCRA